MDHKLNFDEFCIAMFLIRSHKHGDEIPTKLPESFLCSVNPELLNCVSPILNKLDVRKKKLNASFDSPQDSPTMPTTKSRKSKTEVLLGVKSIDEDRLFVLIEKLIDPKKGVPVQTHKSFLKTYKDTFLGINKNRIFCLSCLSNQCLYRQRFGGLVVVEKHW